MHRRRDAEGRIVLYLDGTLPPKADGPPLHVHFLEREEGLVRAGTLGAQVGGEKIVVPTGGTAVLPAGIPHRWWNAGDDELVFRGTATPAVDLDRFLHALFEVLNAGAAGRPPLFYLAHVLYRHRKTQTTLVMPRIVQSVMLPITVLIGTVVGKYRGSAWPGCPERCVGAPPSSNPNA